MIKLVNINSLCLKYASDDLKDNYDLVLAAVK